MTHLRTILMMTVSAILVCGSVQGGDASELVVAGHRVSESISSLDCHDVPGLQRRYGRPPHAWALFRGHRQDQAGRTPSGSYNGKNAEVRIEVHYGDAPRTYTLKYGEMLYRGKTAKAAPSRESATN